MNNPAGNAAITLVHPAVTVARNATLPLVPYHWDTLVWKDITNSRIFAFAKDGTILSQGAAGSTADDTVIAAAIANTPAGGTLQIMPGTYIVGAAVSFFDMISDIKIFGYGATIQAGTARGIMFRTATGSKTSLYGLTIDANKISNTIISGSTALAHIPSLIKVVDCTLLNYVIYGISNGGGNFASGINDTIVDVQNTTINAGTPAGDDECIFTNACKFTNVVNCKLYNWKTFYLTGQNVNMSNVYASSEGYSPGAQQMPINAENIFIENLYMADHGLTLRSPGNGDMANRYGNAKRIYVNGLTNVQPGGVNYKWLSLQPYSSTEIIENVELHNLNCYQGPINVYKHATSPSKSLVKQLLIDGLYVNTMDTNNNIIVIEGEDVDLLTIRNVRTPAYAASAAPIRLYANGADVTVNYADIDNVYPLSDGNLLRVLQDTGGSPPSRAITINFKEPWLKNIKGLNSSGTVAPTVSLKFYKNAGKFTASGNASTTVFNIPHSLVSSPSANSIRITPGHADARGDPVITADATNIIVTYPAAPPSGTNNVILFWSAEAG
jgi:hypothetical protein